MAKENYRNLLLLIVFRFAIVLMAKYIMVNKPSNTKRVNPIEPACKKKIYNSYEEAQEMILHIRESRRVESIRPYKCIYCGLWHLTSKSK